MVAITRGSWLEGAALTRRRGCAGWIVRLGCIALVVYALWYGMGQGSGGFVQKAERLLYPVSYKSAILESSERHNVDPLFVCAVIRTESGWDPDVSSVKGAKGLMQLMPATASDLIRLGLVDGSAFSADNLADPATNIEFGCAYIELAQKQLSGMDEVICSYNAGIAKVQEWLARGDGSVAELSQEYPETADYLKKVKSAYGHYQDLYTAQLEEAD